MCSLYSAPHSAPGTKSGVVGEPDGSVYHASISANNEVARDVLARLLNGLHRVLGIHSVGEMDPEPTYTWDLTSDADGTSLVRFRRVPNVYCAPLIMETASKR